MKIRIPSPAILLATLSMLASSPAFAGLVMKQVSKTIGEGVGMNTTTLISVDTGGARIDFLEMTENPMMPAGSYMLMRPDDDGMILVNPKEKTWATIDFAGMMQSMSGMMGGPGGEGSGMTREASKPIVEKLLEEDGGTILGRPTKHFRWHTISTMTMTMAPGMSMITESDSVEDVWVTPMPLERKVIRGLESMGGASIPSEFADFVATAKAAQQGLPLKQVTVTKSKMTGTGMMAKMMKGAGGGKPTTTTIEVVELAEQRVPASTFSIPADYSETEMMSPGMKMPDMNSRQ